MTDDSRKKPALSEFFQTAAANLDGVRASRADPEATAAGVRWYQSQQDGMARFLFRDLPPLGTVLDVGCGAGEFYARLPTAFAGQYTGIDPAQPMLDIFETEKTIRARRVLLCGTISDTRLLGASFDYVLAIGVWQLIPSQQREDFIMALGRLLNPGAILAIDFFNSTTSSEKDSTGCASLSQMNDLLKRSGLAIRRVAAFWSLAKRFRRPWRLWSALDGALRTLGPFEAPSIVDRWGHRVIVVAEKRTAD